MEKTPLVEFKDIYKIYKMGDEEVHALDGISFKIYQGEFVAIIGASGSGKSTLMNMIGGIDNPTSGAVIIEGKNISNMDEDELAIFRRRNLGIIYQFYNLISTLTAEENIALPWKLDGRREDKKRLKEIIQMLGLEKRDKCLVVSNREYLLEEHLLMSRLLSWLTNLLVTLIVKPAMK